MNNYTSFDDAWYNTLIKLIGSPRVNPRGAQTCEVLGHGVSFPIYTSILSNPRRQMSYAFMYAEAAWILSGSNRLNDLTETAPSYGKFSDDGFTLAGAYGPKVIDQIAYVVDALCNDPSSRQAVINIWRENPRQSKDIPCTLNYQFFIRDNLLHMVVNMRSNDVWLGMPYDVFSAAMVAFTVGLYLRKKEPTGFAQLELGTMFHNAGSRHLYLKNLDRARSACHPSHTPVSENIISLVESADAFKEPPDLADVLRLASKQAFYGGSPNLEWLYRV